MTMLMMCMLMFLCHLPHPSHPIVPSLETMAILSSLSNSELLAQPIILVIPALPIVSALIIAMDTILVGVMERKFA